VYLRRGIVILSEGCKPESEVSNRVLFGGWDFFFSTTTYGGAYVVVVLFVCLFFFFCLSA
jgi:hypothetical protein